MDTLPTISSDWWKRDPDKAHAPLFQYMETLKKDQSKRHEKNLMCAQIYAGRANVWFLSSAAGIGSFGGYEDDFRPDKISFNALQSVIDTITSKIAKNKPRALFMTKGGDRKLQERAKNMGYFTEAISMQSGLYQEMPRGFKDCAIFGDGAVKIFRDGRKICTERTLIDEITVDEVEAYHGKPRQMHQTKIISRETLLAQYPEHEETIIKAQTHEIRRHGMVLSNMVPVVEAWHLDSGGRANDGRKIIAIENDTLFDDSYEYDYFPFVFLKWSDPIVGFFSQGVVERCWKTQREIDVLLTRIQQAMNLIGVPRIFMNVGSRIVSSHITNEIGGIIEYVGEPPRFYTAQAMNSETYKHLETLKAQIYEETGVSQLSATSRKPAGLESGIALREYNDIETERFMRIGQMYEEAYLDASRQIINLGKEIADEYGNFHVTGRDGKNIFELKWSDVNMQEDEYSMEIFPTSLLPSSPAAKLQTGVELVGAGIISKEQFLKLLDYPDLEDIISVEAGATDVVDEIIKIIYEGKEPPPPTAYINLPYAVKRMALEETRGLMEGVPEAQLEQIHRWIQDANLLIEQAKAEMMQQQQAAKGVPAAAASPNPAAAAPQLSTGG